MSFKECGNIKFSPFELSDLIKNHLLLKYQLEDDVVFATSKYAKNAVPLNMEEYFSFICNIVPIFSQRELETMIENANKSYSLQNVVAVTRQRR